MAWSKCGESGYAIQDAITSRFSVIAAKWNSNLELVAISNSNTNGEVFYELMKLLSQEIKDRYGDFKDRIVITLDGARYHWVANVAEHCKSEELMVIEMPPYTPQFSPVELFINCAKSKIRMELRENK